MIKIQFINQSSDLSQSDAQRIVKALAIQVTRDFAPLWGANANLYLAPASQAKPTPGYWVIAFLDDADQAGALGYHDLTPEGLPLGKIFVKTTLADGSLVSVTASHECLEMLADPDINLSAEFDDVTGAPSKFYGYEVCDAVEDDSLGYTIGTTVVSDFVTPAYFSQSMPGPFDFMKKVTAPFSILPGGYMGVLDLANLGQGWQQVTARHASLGTRLRARAPIGSRRERRSIPRANWVRSKW